MITLDGYSGPSLAKAAGKLPVLFLTALLAACGGGGGGGGDNGGGSGSSSSSSSSSSGGSSGGSSSSSSGGSSGGSSSSSGGSSSSSSGGGEAAPDQPTLAMEPQAIKTFQFSWDAVNGADEYRLLENEDGSSGYETIATLDSETTSYDLVVFLPKKVNARYMLQACNSIGCTDSESIAVSGNLVEAVGYVKASNTDIDDNFGYNIAISSDGATLVVGAKGESSAATGLNGDQADNSAPNSGAVYVYRLVDGTWLQEAYLKASNAEAEDLFGTELSLSADGNILAVGAPGEDSSTIGINGNQADNNAEDSGAAYIFTRNGDSWLQQAYLKASDTETGKRLGYRVSLSADGSTLAASVFSTDYVNATGGVYIFTTSDTQWQQQAYLESSNIESGDRFMAVSLSADGNTLVVGASGEDSNATGINGDQIDNSSAASGALYVFTRSEEVWQQQSYIKVNEVIDYNQLGNSVTISDDGNTIAAYAFGDSNGAAYSGAVYVFNWTEAGWQQRAYLKAPNPTHQGNFGRALSLSSDAKTLVIGATRDPSAARGINGDQYDYGSRDSGAAHLFTLVDGEWIQQAYLKASNTPGLSDDDEGSEYFGQSLALSGDGNIIAISAHLEDSAATGLNGDQSDNSAKSSGAVYIY